MELCFKEKDYKMIEASASKLGLSIKEVLCKSGEATHLYTDIYENPKTRREYSKHINVDFDISESEFKRIAERANRYGVTIEMMMLEAVRVYDFFEGK